MANEIRVDYPSGNNLYSCIRQDGGNVWYIAGSVFEAWGTGARDADDYDIVLTDRSGSRYEGDIPTDLPAGTYDRQVFLRTTGTPIDTDIVLGSIQFGWNGSSQPGSLGTGLVQSLGYIGDYKDDETIHFTWDTNGVLPSTAGDIRVYVDGSTTELPAPTGLTDTRAFDGLDGINHCTIDLSANSSYQKGVDVSVVLVGEIIDAQTVNIVLANFSVQNRFQGAEFRKDI